MSVVPAENRVSVIVPELLEARRTGLPVDRAGLGGVIPTEEEAYRIQAEVASVVGEIGGFKVANKPGAPRIMAPIFRKDILQTPACIDVPAKEEIGIELEIGFLIDAALPGKEIPNRREAIARCLSVLPVIEIVRTRLPRDVSPALKLADNQINGGLVVGAPVRHWSSLALGEVEASLSLGGERILDGTARVPGGEAFENFLVLEEMIGDHCGGLRPGHVVITGSLNGLPYCRAGTGIEGWISGLGGVSLRLNVAT